MPLTVIDSLKRGVGAGAIAGLLYGAYLGVVQTPLIEYMGELAHHGDEHGHEAGEALVLGDTATVLGGIGGGILWGILAGAAFGVAYYLLEPALPGASLRPYVLAAAGFITVSATPWLVLPPTGPGAEQALTPETRLAIYGGLMLLGAFVCALSALAYSRGVERGGRRLGLVAGAAPLVLLFVGGLFAPTLVSGGPPETLATAFRGTVAVGQIGLWMLLAAAFVRLPTARRGSSERPLSEPLD